LHKVLGGVVVLPRGTKETDFFARSYHKGIDWYADHFCDGNGDIPIGEFDPNFFTKEAVERIHLHLPDCRLICTMRDPVDRTYSLYKHMRRMGRTRSGFMDWLPELKDGNRYAEHLRLWQQRFGAAQILVTFFDDLQADAQSYLNRISDFIGAAQVELQPSQLDDDLRNHVETAPHHADLARLISRFRRMLQSRSAYSAIRFLGRVGFWKFFLEGGVPYPPLSSEVERRTRERFRPEVEALEELTGRDLMAWKYLCGSLELDASSSAFGTQSEHRGNASDRSGSACLASSARNSARR
jgi:hypothetical protein